MKYNPEELKQLRELHKQLKEAVPLFQRSWVNRAMRDKCPDSDKNIAKLVTLGEMMLETIEGIKNETGAAPTENIACDSFSSERGNRASHQ